MDVKDYIAGEYDVVVIGAGHAGAEAGLASARMGLKTMILTMNLDSIVAMSCNPNIGGTGKGHLVREIDALGGEMAKNIDKCYIQSRMLNTSKGPAVHSLRVQADKRRYHDEMKKTIEHTKNLDLRQGEAVELLIEDEKCTGVKTKTGAIYKAKAVVVATGTYLKGRVYIGELNYSSGPDGMQPADHLSSSLESIGLTLMRFKTGTPARVHKRSINYENLEIQEGDKDVVPFSFLNFDKDIKKEQVPCYLTYTTPKAHEIIRENLHRSALYLGDIKGLGPRYCPSIEDKVVRFKDKDKHQVFLEPEGLSTDEIYVQGVSSSLPEEVQIELYKHIEGLENVEFMRTAYAIEYDAIDATALKLSLEHMNIENLFFAGQINGSSGYEEAGAQGLIAGINAAQKVKGNPPFIMDRSQGYIGVLIDDLVTKGTREPYRMMTARAEYRLSLRQDNADLRLTQIGRDLGLVSDERYEKFLKRKNSIESELERLSKLIITPTEENNKIIESLGSTPINNALSLKEIIRRPELSYEKVKGLDPDRPEVTKDVAQQLNISIKYEGYIKKQEEQMAKFKKIESKSLDKDFDYESVQGLRIEAKEKLQKIKPESIGQASRITGVSPADINVLLIHLEKLRRSNGI